MKHKTQATSHHVQGVSTQEDDESDVDVNDFDFDDDLESDEIAYGYQFVQQLPEQKHYLEDMRGNDTYCLNMKDLKGRLDMFWVLLDNQSTVASGAIDKYRKHHHQ